MEKIIEKYLSGNCSDDERKIAIALLQSKSCEYQLDEPLHDFWNNLQNSNLETKENRELLFIIHQKIAEAEAEKAKQKIVLYKNLLKVAASLILILTSTLIYFQIKNTTTPILEAENIVNETITVPYGAKTKIKLADSTIVWLNSGSTFSYPRQFGSTRQVSLTGEAFFEVKKSEKTFLVETTHGTITVHGTQFNVNTFDSNHLETTLVEGKVQITSKNKETISLAPGQQATVDANNQIDIKKVNTELYTSWIDGKLMFVNEPFASVAEQLERWYNVKIELRGERLKKLGYTATIQMETFGEVLELINVTTPIQYKFDKNSRLLVINQR